jgi:multidrug efflux pump subunit AcrA (membrane-fusion protein)
MDFKQQHDQLLENMPEGVSHDTASCIICNPDASVNADATSSNSTEGGDMKTYTEDELAAAVREAMAPLQAELDTVRASQAEEEIANRIEAAKAEVAAQVSELQLELDKAELRATEAEKSRDESVAWLEAEATAAEQAALAEARKSERLDSIKEVASFSDEYVAANLDRWVAMDDEAFAAYLEDLKAVAAKPAVETDSEETATIPAETAMDNTTSTESVSASKSVFGARAQGVDIRKLY